MSAGSAGEGLAGLSFALVGGGRVGSSVARWLLARGARLAVVGRRVGAPGSAPARLPRWARAAGARLVPLAELDSAGLDLLLLAVPDPVLAEVAAALAVRPQAGVALHTSGPLGAGVLAPLRAGGTQVGGLHPLRAFPRPLPSLAVARRTFLALQGDEAAVALGARLARALGAPHAVVPEAVRPLYHLAASLAAGGAVTLLAAAAGLRAAAGVAPEAAAGLHALATGALLVAPPAQPAAALTGPVARGDRGFLGQLAALRATDPALHPLAVLLALETLRQLTRSGGASAERAALAAELRKIAADPGFLAPLLAEGQVLSSPIPTRSTQSGSRQPGP